MNFSKANEICCLPGARWLWVFWQQQLGEWTDHVGGPGVHWQTTWFYPETSVLGFWTLGWYYWCRPSKMQWRSRQLPSSKGLRKSCRRNCGKSVFFGRGTQIKSISSGLPAVLNFAMATMSRSSMANGAQWSQYGKRQTKIFSTKITNYFCYQIIRMDTFNNRYLVNSIAWS